MDTYEEIFKEINELREDPEVEKYGLIDEIIACAFKLQREDPTLNIKEVFIFAKLEWLK
jgi:hypothetical protein